MVADGWITRAEGKIGVVWVAMVLVQMQQPGPISLQRDVSVLHENVAQCAVVRELVSNEQQMTRRHVLTSLTISCSMVIHRWCMLLLLPMRQHLLLLLLRQPLKVRRVSRYQSR